MKIQKGTFESIILFVLTPVLSLPVLLYNIKRGNKVATSLLAVFFGVIGYLFVPAFSNDKTRYLERYELLRQFSFNDFTSFLSALARPDFIFDFSLYFFAANNFNIQVLFFLINAFVAYTIVQVGIRLTNVEISKEKFYGLIISLLIFSISLPTLFSGVRFYFGAAFILWAFQFLLIDKNRIKCILCFTLGVCTHFSLFLFIFPILGVMFFPKGNFRILFSISLIFLLLPKEFLGFLVANLSPSESYNTKAEQYLEGDMIGEGMKNNIANVIVFYLRQIWVYIAYAYLFFFKRKHDKNDILLSLLYLVIFFVNLTFSVPTVFSRFSAIIKILFAILLIKEAVISKDRKVFFIFLGLYLLSFALDIYLLRINLAESLFFRDIVTSVGIIARKITLYDVIK